MSENKEKSAELRFIQLGALALRLHRVDPGGVLETLRERKRQAPALLDGAALALDLEHLPEDQRDPERIERVLSALQNDQVQIIGLCSGEAAEKLAHELKIPILDGAVDARNGSHEAHSPDPAPPALHVDQHVRSGQQIYARGSDLVVAGIVSAGAEIIADGSIHVYGALRGRALAGARGESSARVYSLEFHAELVSVAGQYKVFEDLPGDLRGKSVQAWLEGEQLRLATLG